MAFDPSQPSPIVTIPDTSWHTINQQAAIGSVVAAWSWLDMGVQALLARLTQTDDMLVQALTEDLSIDNRLKALRRLVRTWEHFTVGTEPDRVELWNEIRAIAVWIAKNKGTRNEIAHWTWLRQDDATMFGWKHHLSPALKDERPSRQSSTTEMLQFSSAIGVIVARLENAVVAARALPAWHEPSLETPLTLGLASLLRPYVRRGGP
jgi:hypothetical protein